MKRLGIERFPAFLLCVVICCYASFVMLIAVRLRIDLAYDGTDFYGWAKQPDMRTVQGEIERVLHTVLRVPEGDDDEPLRLTVAGRTIPACMRRTKFAISTSMRRRLHVASGICRSNR